MRLFVGIRPEPETLAGLEGLRRADVDGVRWVAPEQLHLTLRFMGDVAADEVPTLIDGLASTCHALPPVTATLGPATRRLAGRMLVVPVAGIDALAAEVVRATSTIGRPPDERPFAGHVTLCRAGGRGRLPRGLTPEPVSLSWPVHEVALVRSHLGPDGARYETLFTAPLASGGADRTGSR